MKKPHDTVALKEIAIPSDGELPAELMAVIVAAAQAAMRKKIKITLTRYRRQPPPSSWVIQGRATTLLASYNIKR